MPQIYRRHSEYAPSALTESRLRTTIAASPQLTDADDSIVLSDLVRTGEASRLRRRGAMRLEHGAPRPVLTGAPPIPPPSSRFGPLAPRPLVVPPSRPSSPGWGLNSYGAQGGADDDGRFSFSLSAENWRPGEWGPDEPPSEAFPTQPGMDEDRRDFEREDLAEAEKEYVLVCGGDETFAGKAHVEPFKPSILPISPRRPPSPSTSRASPDHSVRRSNGCGAIVHMRAIPQRRRGVWQGAAHAAPTDVVVGLDSSYFDRGVVAKMLRSACGCVREGVGCAACGNPLGTRYLPCPAASEGIFSGPNASTSSGAQPRHPDGPSYWDSRLTSTSRSRRSDNFFVYTFFADRVSSQPPVDFNFKMSPPLPSPSPSPSPSAPVLRRAPQREQERMPDILIVSSPNMPAFASLDEQQTESGQGWYGFRTTASPRPFSYAESVTEILDSPVVPTVPLPLTAVEDIDSDTPYDRLGGMLDADGVLLDPEARVDDYEGVSTSHLADNDKSTVEARMASGR